MIIVVPVGVVLLLILLTLAVIAWRASLRPPVTDESVRRREEWNRARRSADSALLAWRRSPDEKSTGALQAANARLRETAEAVGAVDDVGGRAEGSAAPGTDAIGQIERLGGLLQQGFITRDEFDARKRELLDRIR